MKNKFTLKKIVFAFLLLTSFATYAQIVTTNADDGSPGSLRSQVANANPGDIILFAPGVTSITLTSGQITIDKTITISGNGVTPSVSINGNAASRIFDITSGTVTLIDLILTNGLADNGGAVQVFNSNLLLLNTNVTNSVANGASGSGGGLYIGTGATLTVTNSAITGNQANRAGGGIESVAGTTTTLNNVTLNSNNAGVSPATAAPGNGGGLHVTGNGTVTISGGTVNMNIAAAEGGGLWNGSGMMMVDGTTIDSNTASGVAADNGGGGIYQLNGGTLMLENVTISNNEADGTAGSGGGILSDTGSTLTINNSLITGNTSNRAGGGIEINAQATGATATLTNVSLNNNTTFTSPGNGGGLHVTGLGTVSINDGTVNNNMAGAEGGGLWNGTGTMTIDGTTISANTASGAAADNGGGGIYNLNGGTLMISNAVISNNSANGTLGSGGGILNDVGSQLMITDSEISGNTAIRAGGGIEDNSGTSTITLSDVNLDNNSVTGPPGNGGGLHITGAGSVMITGGTVNDNTASLEGGGLWNGTGTMTIMNTEIDGNIAQGAAADDGGGGIFNNGGTVNVENANLTNNLATGVSGSGGGLLSIAGTITITESLLNGNSANRAGGAIETIAGTLNIMDSNLTNNDVNGGAGTANPGNGGAVHISGITTTMITESRIAGNEAMREGGGLWNQTGSTMTISYTTVESNEAHGPLAAHGGGGIFNNGGTLNVDHSTIAYNISDGALGNGGGIHVKSGMADILLSTISGNSSSNDGGGIYNNAGLSVNATTIAFNAAAADGGGVANNSTTAGDFKNSIIALNSAAASFDLSSDSGSYTSNGYNLIGQDGGNVFTAVATDIEGTSGNMADPMLAPLADNGGETYTHMLMNNSPAYNAGDPSDQFADQIDNPVFAGIRDIGSYEAQSQLGIEDLTTSAARTQIYPNPSTGGVLNIRLAAGFENETKARIVETASGKTVMEFDVEPISQINTLNLASGVYVIHFASQNNSESIKLIVAN